MPTAIMNRTGFDVIEAYEAPKMLIARYMFKHECSNVQAQAVFNEMKKFLWVCAKHPGRRHAPSQIVDGMWHELVQFSHEYFALCRLLGVDYIHHRPTKGADQLAYRRTRQAIAAEFGSDDKGFWPERAAADCTGESECGS